MAVDNSRLLRETEALQQVVSEQTRRFETHLNKARTEMDEELQKLNGDIVQLTVEQDGRISYYDQKIAHIITQLNKANQLLADRGFNLLAGTEGFENESAESRRRPEPVQLVAGTTSLVSSQLLRSYQPIDTFEQTWNNATGPVAHPQMDRDPRRRPGPLFEDELVINGQVGRKGDLHEWNV